MKIMYVKCLMRNEYESYLRRNEHYLQCSALHTELTSLRAGIFSLLLEQCSLPQRLLSYSFLNPRFTCMIFIYSKRLIHYLTNFIMNQRNYQSTAPVSQRSLVHIPYRPEFSGLIFTTATVVFITAKISFIFKLILKVNQQEKIKISRSLVY